MLQVEHHAQAERPRRLGSGHQQRVEHPAAVLPVVGQAAEEQGRALAAGGDVEGVGRLGTVELGHLGTEQDGPPEHRGRVGPGPSAGEVVGPGIALRRTFEPRGVDLVEGDVDLQDRPAGPEPIALGERGQPAAVARIDQRAGRGGLHQGRAAVIDVEAIGLHLADDRVVARLAQARHDELLADPGRRLAHGHHAADPAGGLVDLDLDRLVLERAAPGGEPAGRGGGLLEVRLGGHPGEAEGGHVHHGVDSLVGELGRPEGPLGAEVERGVGQDHRHAPGNSQRVDHEVARAEATTMRRRAWRGSPGPAARPSRAPGRRAPAAASA